MTADSTLNADVVNCFVECGAHSMQLVLSALGPLQSVEKHTTSLGSVCKKVSGSNTASMAH